MYKEALIFMSLVPVGKGVQDLLERDKLIDSVVFRIGHIEYDSKLVYLVSFNKDVSSDEFNELLTRIMKVTGCIVNYILFEKTNT